MCCHYWFAIHFLFPFGKLFNKAFFFFLLSDLWPWPYLAHYFVFTISCRKELARLLRATTLLIDNCLIVICLYIDIDMWFRFCCWMFVYRFFGLNVVFDCLILVWEQWIICFLNACWVQEMSTYTGVHVFDQGLQSQFTLIELCNKNLSKYLVLFSVHTFAICILYWLKLFIFLLIWILFVFSLFRRRTRNVKLLLKIFLLWWRN